MILDLDFDVLLVEPRKIGAPDDLVVAIHYVDRRPLSARVLVVRATEPAAFCRCVDREDRAQPRELLLATLAPFF